MGSAPRTLHRAAWLEIDLRAIRHNVGVIRSLIGNAALAPVVKADAYGHGFGPVAEALSDVSDALCVATLDEAIASRASVGGRVILLYPVPGGAARDAVACGAELTIMAPSDLRQLRAVTPAARAPVALQLCVETGMGRGGLSAEETATVGASIAGDQRLRVAGVWTHLACPADPEATREQLRRFETACASLGSLGGPVLPRHVVASSAIFAGTAPPLEMARPGLAIYGLLDDGLPLAGAGLAAAARLRPAMALKARPVAFSHIASGERVGYGGQWQAGRHSRIAILPIGYADGYLRLGPPGARALVRGVAVPIVGVVSMDALAVDVTDLPDVGAGDEFTLLGRQGDLSITASELARSRNTIVWEVCSSMAARLDRVYYPADRLDRGAESVAP
jgi:alanine racemase